MDLCKATGGLLQNVYLPRNIAERECDLVILEELVVFCPGNKLPEFGRRVARLARRQSAGDLARSASEGNAARRDESAEEW